MALGCAATAGNELSANVVDAAEFHPPLILAALAAEAGAPWHAQDRDGHTAGEYASGAKQRHILQQLLDWAVRAELLLGE